MSHFYRVSILYKKYQIHSDVVNFYTFYKIFISASCSDLNSVVWKKKKQTVIDFKLNRKLIRHCTPYFQKRFSPVYSSLVHVVYDIYTGWKIIVRFISVFNIDIFINFFLGYIMIPMIPNMKKLTRLIKGWCIVANQDHYMYDSLPCIWGYADSGPWRRTAGLLRINQSFM